MDIDKKKALAGGSVETFIIGQKNTILSVMASKARLIIRAHAERARRVGRAGNCSITFGWLGVEFHIWIISLRLQPSLQSSLQSCFDISLSFRCS